MEVNGGVEKRCQLPGEHIQKVAAGGGGGEIAWEYD